MIPENASLANPSPKRPKPEIGAIHTDPIPPGQIFVVVRVKRSLAARFEDYSPVQRGENLMMRRSPFPDSLNSYWLEDEDGRLRAVITRDMIGAEVEVRHG